MTWDEFEQLQDSTRPNIGTRSALISTFETAMKTVPSVYGRNQSHFGQPWPRPDCVITSVPVCSLIGNLESYTDRASEACYHNGMAHCPVERTR